LKEHFNQDANRSRSYRSVKYAFFIVMRISLFHFQRDK